MARRKSSKKPPKPVTAGPGEKITVLEVPYDARQVAKYGGAKWDAARRKWVFVGQQGDELPMVLRMFQPRRWSWEAWLNDDLAGTEPTPYEPEADIELRPHQQEAVDTILKAAAGSRPGFLLADEVGLGKTFVAIATACEMPNTEKILVIAPKGVQAGWRKALREYGDGGKRWCLTTPGSLKHLVEIPKSAHEAKRTRTKNKRIANQGTPKVAWDLVIVDESHYCVPGDTIIDTEHGPRPIAELVESSCPTRVWSHSTETGEDELKPVVSFMDSGVVSHLVRIVTSAGAVVEATAQHPVWTENRGWVDAGDIRVDDELVVAGEDLPRARREVSASSQGEVDGKDLFAHVRSKVGGRDSGLDEADLSVLRPDVHRLRDLLPAGVPSGRLDGTDLHPLRRPVRDAHEGRLDGGDLFEAVHSACQTACDGRCCEEGGSPCQKTVGAAELRGMRADHVAHLVGGSEIQAVLLSELLGDSQNEPSRGEGSRRSPDAADASRARSSVAGEEASWHRSADAAGQPDVGPCGTPEGLGGDAGTHVSLPRRTRADHGAATASCGGTQRDGAHGVHSADGTGDGDVAVIAVPLRGGHRATGGEGGGRGRRREQPQDEAVAVPRRTEDRGVGSARVVRVEILERGGSGRRGSVRSAGEERRGWHVFNLEVEDNHNYYANGVLVHNCKNPVAQRSKLARKMRQSSDLLGKKARGGAGTFALWMSATAGANPLELSYLAEELGMVTGKPVTDLEEFAAWCSELGIGISKGAFGALEWAGEPDDLELMRELLFGLWKNNTIPLGMRRKPSDIAGWPEVSVSATPVELDESQRKLYEEAWTEFRKALDMAKRGDDPSNGLAAMTRYRQKASLVRTGATAEFVAELVGSGRQVFVSTKWLESVEALVEELGKKKIDAAMVYGGQSEDEREAERMRFQSGECPVIVGTIVEGVNLQANEHGGNDVPRATVVHDVRFSPLQTHQSLGRCHRDGQDAPAYLLYAEDSVEEDIAQRMLRKVGDMQEMHGDDAGEMRKLERAVVGMASQRQEAFAQAA